jgi:hypothetical protein
MNWQDVIKKISEEFPQLTPEKLYDYVKKTYGSDSDIEDGNPTGEIIENFMGLGPKDISDKDFRAIDHNRNITRILQRANFKK